MIPPNKEDNVGDLRLKLTASTLKKVSDLAAEFEKTRNLGGSLQIIAIKAWAAGDSIEKIANLVGTIGEMLRNWINEFLHQGVHSFTPKTSCGRQEILLPKKKNILIKNLKT